MGAPQFGGDVVLQPCVQTLASRQASMSLTINLGPFR